MTRTPQHPQADNRIMLLNQRTVPLRAAATHFASACAQFLNSKSEPICDMFRVARQPLTQERDHLRTLSICEHCLLRRLQLLGSLEREDECSARAARPVHHHRQPVGDRNTTCSSVAHRQQSQPRGCPPVFLCYPRCKGCPPMKPPQQRDRPPPPPPHDSAWCADCSSACSAGEWSWPLPAGSACTRSATFRYFATTNCTSSKSTSLWPIHRWRGKIQWRKWQSSFRAISTSWSFQFLALTWWSHGAAACTRSDGFL